MKTITTKTEYSFTGALKKLLDGECLGIKPEDNISYVELYKPDWMNPEGPDYLLKWTGKDGNFSIRTNMYFERWYLVIVDHRTIRKN